VLLGRDDEAAFHMKRYRIAYPKDYARWADVRADRIRPASETP